MITEVRKEGQIPIEMWTDKIDKFAEEEADNLASLPFAFHHVALMPDAHAGKGMPIGGVLATKDVIIPNAVGVDIGCGMCAMKTNIKVEELTPDIIRKQMMMGIRKCIPLGRDIHKTAQEESTMPKNFNLDDTIVCKRQYQSAMKQVGTLGGGNHFIELQHDTEGFIWVMIHSGSRHLGKSVGDYYNKKAIFLNEHYFSKVSAEKELAFLPMCSKEFHQYWIEMQYCIAFAFCNRLLMMERIKEVIADSCPNATFDPIINIAHNYAAWENHFGEKVLVHRKGAVNAEKGRIGIIPGSQGSQSYIVEGLGNEDSFCSSSHGAGRVMSRTEAVHTLSLEKEQARLDALGIIHALTCKDDLEEATGAYKDITQVMKNQQDLVRPLVELSPIAVIKGK